MNRIKWIVAVVGTFLLMSSSGYAQENGFPSNFVDLPPPVLVWPDSLLHATKSGLGITLGGTVELEYVNVEGKGGFANQDLTVKKVKTRSPHVRIDKAVLEPKIYYSDNLTYQIEFRFDDNDAYVDKHYARLFVPAVKTVFQLGKDRPMIYRKRQTEGYPLIGTAYYKGREFGLHTITEFQLGSSVNTVLGLTVAMKRPLGSDDAAEDKSFKMLVYDDYEVKDGQTTTIGGMLGGNLGVLSLLGWYYYGELIDDFDWKTQLSQTLPGYDELGVPTDLTHYWYGGRAGLDYKNIHALGEVIRSQDGNLPRYGYSAELGYAFPGIARSLKVAGVRVFVRHDVLDVEELPPSLGEPQTWDREMTTAALITDLNKNVALKIEYYWIDEVTGGDPPDDDHVKDDQLLVQLKFNF